MSDQTICTRCGFAGSPEARYCARCGRVLIPPRARLAASTGRWFDHLSPRTLGLVGLVASIPIGALAHHLLVKTGLLFSLSHLSLVLIIGAGSAYLGWQWRQLPSNRTRLVRVLVVFIAVGLLLVALERVDKAAFSLLVPPGQTVVSDIPGVYIEATDGVRYMSVDAPPYSLLTIAYTVIVGTASSLVRRLYTTLMTREREVDDLRENLLAQVQDTAAQQERNRLARELHDSIKQQIFSISMSAAAAEARWETDPQGAQAALGDLRSVAHEAMVEMNALLQQLSPAPLEKVGLVQALRDQCEALGYRTGAQVTAEFGDLPPNDRLPAGAQESVFRIAQEAFSNVARHARAGQVSLYLGLRDDGDALVLRIQDDGQGFDLETARDGMGLDNIRQRVTALKGDLSIESDLDRGTALQVTVPLAKPSAHREAPLQQDHTLNKVCLIGLAGGLALIATLFYPLYVLLPGNYVDGWMTGSQLLSFVLEIAAVLAAVATGYLAARWAGPNNRPAGALFGALAGGTAGLTLYVGLGAAAAGILGSSAFLQHGLVPATGEAEFELLMTTSAIGIVWWSLMAFWSMVLAGSGLGAMGGMLSPISSQPARLDLRPALRMMLAPATCLNALMLIFAVIAFPPLEASMQDSIDAYSISSDMILPPQGFSLWPIGTAAVLHLAPSIVIFLLSCRSPGARDRAGLGAAQATAVIFGLLSFGIASYLLITGPGLSISLTSPLGAIIAVTIVAGFALGIGYLVIFIKVRRQRRMLGLIAPLRITRIVAIIGLLWSVGMIVWGMTLPMPWLVLVSLLVATADGALIAWLYRQPKQPTTGGATLARLQETLVQTINAGLGSVVALVTTFAAADSCWVSLLVTTRRAADILTDDVLHISSFTLIELIRDAYLAQGRAALVMFAGSAAFVGLWILLISGIIALIKYQVSRSS